MNEKLISHETAKLANQKGFFYRDSKTKYYLNSGKLVKKPTEHLGDMIETNPGISVACTQSILQKWLRENYSIHIIIEPCKKDKILFYEGIVISDLVQEENYGTILFNIYEECLEDALQDALNLI